MRRSILKLIAEQSPERPACFDSHAQWVDWLASAHIAGIAVVRRVDVGKHADNRRTYFEVLPVGLQSHCGDCSEIRQERMRCQRRCFPVKPRASTADGQSAADAVAGDPGEGRHFVEPERRPRGPFDALFRSEETA